MAFDQPTRNRLQKFVSDSRDLLSKEFRRQLQAEYGMDPTTGGISSLDVLTYLDDNRLETARLLRDTLEHYLAGDPSHNVMECLDRIVREQAFTVLNRLCALRMAEARGILIESIGNGYQSRGFQLYARLAGPALGETGDAYRCYLFSIFDEFALDLAVLFDRFSPQDRLFPRESALLELLSRINHPDIAPLWAEDETIGWIYQYFNSPEERRQMRAESQAPRTSRELAVRNQFFTPRYVVEVLTDNTLGRIWYEMTQGNTVLKEQCRYLVRRPNEIFLAEGKEAPQQNEPAENLSQEELLKQPVYIPLRRLKDPREILMLDPACGSMHFGLYAFDLFEKIYEEAWELEGRFDTGVFARSGRFKSLRETYGSKEALTRDVPRLIIEYNIHGIDIDPRAVQIAGLSLWLRAQRSWQTQGIKPQDRPQILKSNVVCAEPMPGEKEMLREFTESIKPRVLGQLVEIIFDKMQLAGEAGSLLKIEEEIETAIAEAREYFKEELLHRREAEATLFPELLPPRQLSLFDFTDMPDKTQFWNDAEQKILNALREYAERAEITHANRKRLFTRDAARGFAFIDIYRKRYDVVLMNPPFGLAIRTYFNKLKKLYPDGYVDLYSSFLQRGFEKCTGMLGAITSRSWLITKKLNRLRTNTIVPRLTCLLDLGWPVMDGATVQSCAFIIQKEQETNPYILAIDRKHLDSKSYDLEITCKGLAHPGVFYANRNQILLLPQGKVLYQLPSCFLSIMCLPERFSDNAAIARQGLKTFDDFRFIRLKWEVDPKEIGSTKTWEPFTKGGNYAVFYSELNLLICWRGNGKEICEVNKMVNGQTAQARQASEYYRKHGGTYSRRSKDFGVRALPEGFIIGEKGPAILSNNGISPAFAIGFLNSRLVRCLVNIQANAKQYDTGIIDSLPWIKFNGDDISRIEHYVFDTINILRDNSRYDEGDPLYIGFPIRGSISEIFDELVGKSNKAEISINESIANINCIVDRVYGIDSGFLEPIIFNQGEIDSESDLCQDQEPNLDNDANESELNRSNVSMLDVCSKLMSYLVGLVMGYWDVCYPIEEKTHPELPNPFCSFPVCPPGMLQRADGLPAGAEDIPRNYPLKVSWSGILVDDEDRQEDIVYRVRDVLEVIWKDKAGDIEQEACEIMGVSSLRDYFSKPGNFFAYHFKQYSKSRRQAPIYWPLSTASGSYTLWLYYHRLTDQTLYTCVNDFVEPKLKEVAESASQLRQKYSRSSAEEKELERLSDLELELKDFRDELLRIASFWKPNLNDGVQITASPLWKLFRYTPWQRTLKETWDKLQRGDYDWAHLAYCIWPKRVQEKCKRDKSLAIAHDLEELYEEQAVEPKKRRR
jgi:hypothetical protein